MLKNKHFGLIAIATLVVAACLTRGKEPQSPTTQTTKPAAVTQQTKQSAVQHEPPMSTPIPTNNSTAPVPTTGNTDPSTIVEIPYYLMGSTNDPGYYTNWAHSASQTGRGWDLATGSSSTVVAVIDTGFELNHQDLTGRWAENNGELGTTANSDSCWTGIAADKATNNCDDDGNGYIDDWRGYDFVNDDNSVQAGETNPDGDSTQHGSMVAGVIGATANNGLGGVGVDQQANIMPLQVFDDDGNASTSYIVDAIDYATENGANVINLSLGTNVYDAPLRAAIGRALAANVLVIAASGNCALNDQPICTALTAPGRMTYPALYPEVLAVGATTSTGQRASFSSFGSELDIAAPGQSVGPLPVFMSTGELDFYATASGTSFSSPLVAGLASLIIAQKPDIAIADLEFAITESAEKLTAMGGSNFTTTLGYGLANVHRATLLGKALSQISLLGNRELSPREAPAGNMWRASTGSVANDETVLIGCRVATANMCSASAKLSDTNKIYTTPNNTKAGPLQYIFIDGKTLTSGTWALSLHNNQVAKGLGTLTK